MLISAALSACGATHERNDDRILVDTSALAGAEQPGTQATLSFVSANYPYVAGVFDGVGGSVRGDKAALAAVESLQHASGTLPERLEYCVKKVAENQAELESHERAYTVGAGIWIEPCQQDSNGAKQAAGTEGASSQLVAGTDETIAAHTPLRAYLFHMGDCRIYRYRTGEFDLLTRDHSLAQRYREEAGVDAPVPRNMAHVVTSYAGGDIEEPFEVSEPLTVHDSDLFVMCSDGFWEHAGIEETKHTLESVGECLSKEGLTSDDLQEALLQAAQTLTEIAKNNGSPDDISIILTWNAPVAYAD